MAGGEACAAYQTIPCLLNIWLLIEQKSGKGKQKIPQAQGVNEVKKSEAEWLKAATK